MHICIAAVFVLTYDTPTVFCCDAIKKLEGDFRFNELQKRWLCQQVNNWEKLKRDKNGGFRLSASQLAYLDFLEKCNKLECVEFHFPNDKEEEVKMKEISATNWTTRLFGVDWRCTHQNVAWRPRFCQHANISTVRTNINCGKAVLNITGIDVGIRENRLAEGSLRS